MPLFIAFVTILDHFDLLVHLVWLKVPLELSVKRAQEVEVLWNNHTIFEAPNELSLCLTGGMMGAGEHWTCWS